MKVKEWCIALDNVSSYIDSVLGLRYKFLKGERATKEKVFSMIPSMTEEEYARYFRPATEEEINGEFELDGEQYVLEKPKRMKSIEEFATEFAQDKYLPVQTFQAVKTGANYVLDIIEQALTPQKCLTGIGIDVSPEALIKTALQTIEALKKK